MSALSTLAKLARQAAVMLGVSVALRFAFAAWMKSAGEQAGVAGPLGAAGDLTSATRLLGMLDGGIPGLDDAPLGVGTASPAPPPAPPAPQRTVLIVTAPPDRSEVLVDGNPVGRTPFLGDIRCSGPTVRITLVPPRGKPRDVERRCAPGELRVE